MKIKSLLKESYECVKIGGILRNLSNDEMKVYKKVKESGKLFKQELSEYDANVATTMVSKGLLRRKKAQHDEGLGRIYYTTIGRKGHLVRKEIDEVAPPGKESEKWIRKNKKRFKEKYGKDYEKYLYGKAWNNYNGKKKLKENDSSSEELSNLRKDVFELVKKFYTMKEQVEDRNYSDSDFVDFLFDCNQISYPNDASNELKRACWRLNEVYDNIRQSIEEAAYESGSFDVKDPDEYDRIKTHDNIVNNYTFGQFADEYMPNRYIEQTLTECLQEIKESYHLYKDDYEEPEFSGDFDEIQKPEQKKEPYIDMDTKELLEFANKIEATIEANPNSYAELISEFEDLSTSNVKISSIWDTFLDKFWDWVDDTMAGENYSFVAVQSGELNSEQTWEAIWEEGFERLWESYGNADYAEDAMDEANEKLEKLCSILKVPFEISNENDDEDAINDGSEYDE